MSDHVLCLGTWGHVRPCSVLRDMGLCQTMFCVRDTGLCQTICAQGFGVVRQHHLCSGTQGCVRWSSVLRDTGLCLKTTSSVLRDSGLSDNTICAQGHRVVSDDFLCSGTQGCV